MPFAMPSFAPAWLKARETGEAALLLLTITHPMREPVRLVRNSAAVTSRGETYSAAWFEADVINDNDGQPRAELTVPNVDRAIGFWADGLDGPPEVTLEVVGSDHLDEPIYRAARLELRNIEIQPMTVRGQLASRDYSAEPCGTIYVSPGRFPGLFRQQR